MPDEAPATSAVLLFIVIMPFLIIAVPRLTEASPRLPRAPRHDEIADRNLHRIAFLILRRRSHLDQSLMRARFRRSHVEDFALDVQLVTRSHGKWPAELVEARTDDAAGGFEVALDQQSHRERGGMPAACRQAAEYRVARRLFVLVERLRIEFRRECLDALLFDGDAAGAVDPSD